MSMNKFANLGLKLLLLTLGFLVSFVVLTLALAIFFQGHLHPDDWVHTWHDTVWMVIAGITYVFFVVRFARPSFQKDSK